MDTPRVLGSWNFHVENDRLTEGDQLCQMVTATMVAARVVEEAELLYPRRLWCGPWLTLHEGVPTNVGLPDLDLEISSSGLRELEAILRRFLVERGMPEAFPHSIWITGPGKVIDPGGHPYTADNLCGLRSLYDGMGVTVSLETYSDVWLPYDLTGRPQLELSTANAPRLAAALARLGEELLSEVDPGEPTKYAQPDDLGLRNHRDVEGEIIPTLDW
jgi:hypothetical protein